LPLNLLLPTTSSVTASAEDMGKPRIPIDRPMLVLGFAFAASWTVVTAMAVHLPRLLEAAGASTVQAVAAGALIGPSQVGARILEASLMKRFHPMWSARLSVTLHPMGAAVLALWVPPPSRGRTQRRPPPHSPPCRAPEAAFSPLRGERSRWPCSAPRTTA